jgi:hypothetical protein
MSHERTPFWSGMSGFLAGTAALVTAIGGTIAILVQVGVIGGGSSNGGSGNGGGGQTTTQTVDWSSQANDICARANDLITALPNPKTLESDAALQFEQQALRINRQMVRDLVKLPKPTDHVTEVDRFVRLGADVNETTEELLADFTSGSLGDAQQRASTLSRLGERFDAAAIALGATTCAEGSSFSGGLPSFG